MPEFDIAIVGAGILGLASARELLRRRPRLRVGVLDKESSIGRHQTGHNSGVIHSGIYYAPGSLKARLCMAGSREIYAYCLEKGIPAERCGKLIVAADESEVPRLENLYQRGLANGVQGLRMMTAEELREVEPYCVGVRALYSPDTGIVDYTRVASAYADDIRLAEGEIILGAQVVGIAERDSQVVLESSAGETRAKHVIVCAGLQADKLACLVGASPDPKIVPFRGDYWVIRKERRYLARNLIYPVPDPSFPFLGVHFTRRIDDGAVWLGPNAVLAFAREGYRRLDVRSDELLDSLAYPGFRKLAAKYWRTGLAEMWRDFSKVAFLRSLQRYIPDLKATDLLPGPSGVRAQALAPDGSLVDDFVIHHQGRVIHIRNAPSPAATSSLQIARLIADTAEERFGLGSR